MNAGRSLQTFSEFTGELVCGACEKAERLRARADRRVRDRHRPFGLLLLGQTDALAGIASRARNAVNLGQPAWRGLAGLRRIRHQIGHAFTGEGVLGFTAGARRDRRRRVRRHGDDGDGRGDCNSDRKSAGKNQSSRWKLQGRHLHAFCSCCHVAGSALSLPAKPSPTAKITPTDQVSLRHRQ